MTTHDPNLQDEELRAVERALADYASATGESPSPGFADWVMRSVSEEPMPRRGLLAGLARVLTVPGPYRLAAQAAVAIVILVAGVGSAVVLNQVVDRLPTPVVSPSPIPSPAPTRSPEPSVTPSPSPTLAPSPAPSQGGDSQPSSTESEHEVETPRPSSSAQPSETTES